MSLVVEVLLQEASLEEQMKEAAVAAVEVRKEPRQRAEVEVGWKEYAACERADFWLLVQLRKQLKYHLRVEEVEEGLTVPALEVGAGLTLLAGVGEAAQLD